MNVDVKAIVMISPDWPEDIQTSSHSHESPRTSLSIVPNAIFQDDQEETVSPVASAAAVAGVVVGEVAYPSLAMRHRVWEYQVEGKQSYA